MVCRVTRRVTANEASMKTMIVAATTFLLLSANVSAMDGAAGYVSASPKDAADIRQVMDTFHHAVATHDGQGVSALFLDHGTTWVTVLTDAGFTAMKAKKPSVEKVRVGSYQDFAKFVSTSTKTIDPRHTNLRIMSDGAVASVYFHFDFMIDGKDQNSGDETWQLVKTADGWRIVAITYSATPPAA
jgi:ketosteroid isomerase-like protein